MPSDTTFNNYQYYKMVKFRRVERFRGRFRDLARCYIASSTVDEFNNVWFQNLMHVSRRIHMGSSHHSIENLDVFKSTMLEF